MFFYKFIENRLDIFGPRRWLGKMCHKVSATGILWEQCSRSCMERIRFFRLL